MIDLRNNKIEKNGANIIANMLMKQPQLLEIDLRWNNLGADGGQNLFKGINHNDTLIMCHLSGNQIPVHTLRAIG